MKKQSCDGFCGHVGWPMRLHEKAQRRLRTPGGVIAAAALRIQNEYLEFHYSGLDFHVISFFVVAKLSPRSHA